MAKGDNMKIILKNNCKKHGLRQQAMRQCLGYSLQMLQNAKNDNGINGRVLYERARDLFNKVFTEVYACQEYGYTREQLMLVLNEKTFKELRATFVVPETLDEAVTGRALAIKSSGEIAGANHSGRRKRRRRRNNSGREKFNWDVAEATFGHLNDSNLPENTFIMGDIFGKE